MSDGRCFIYHKSPTACTIVGALALLSGFIASAKELHLAPGDLAVTASSQLPSKSGQYGIANVLAGDPSKAWCEGAGGDGVNEWIQIDVKPQKAAKPADIIRLKILPGYGKSPKLYAANARPARITVKALDRTTGSTIGGKGAYNFVLKDNLQLQVLTLELASPHDASKIRLLLTIDSVYKGGKYQDLCISEIDVVMADKKTLNAELSYQEEEAIIAQETEVMRTLLPAALKGDRHGIQSVVRLAGSYYIKTAEGGAWIDESYVELLVKQPYAFLFIVSQQEAAMQDRIEQALLAPMTDKYPETQLLAAVKTAKAQGLSSTLMGRLEKAYSGTR